MFVCVCSALVMEAEIRPYRAQKASLRILTQEKEKQGSDMIRFVFKSPHCLQCSQWTEGTLGGVGEISFEETSQELLQGFRWEGGIVDGGEKTNLRGI